MRTTFGSLRSLPSFVQSGGRQTSRCPSSARVGLRPRRDDPESDGLAGCVVTERKCSPRDSSSELLRRFPTGPREDTLSTCTYGGRTDSSVSAGSAPSRSSLPGLGPSDGAARRYLGPHLAGIPPCTTLSGAAKSQGPVLAKDLANRVDVFRHRASRPVRTRRNVTDTLVLEVGGNGRVGRRARPGSRRAQRRRLPPDPERGRHLRR